MIVRVRVFGHLGKYCNKSSLEEFELPLPEDSKPKDLLKSLGIQQREIILLINPGKEEKIVTINDAWDNRKQVALRENDTIWVYPFLAGG